MLSFSLTGLMEEGALSEVPDALTLFPAFGRLLDKSVEEGV